MKKCKFPYITRKIKQRFSIEVHLQQDLVQLESTIPFIKKIISENPITLLFCQAIYLKKKTTFQKMN